MHNNQPMTVAAVQVSAGSIKFGELPEQAAIRELLEETGRHWQVIRSVGIQRYDLRPARDEVAVRHYFEMRSTNADIAEPWGGWRVRFLPRREACSLDLPVAPTHICSRSRSGVHRSPQFHARGK